MKVYITQKDISVGQGIDTVYQGTMYLPDVDLQICRARNYQIQPFDAYLFRVVQVVPDSLEEFEVDEEKIYDILSKRSKVDKVKQDLEAALRNLYKDITTQKNG